MAYEAYQDAWKAGHRLAVPDHGKALRRVVGLTFSPAVTWEELGRALFPEKQPSKIFAQHVDVGPCHKNPRGGVRLLDHRHYATFPLEDLLHGRAQCRFMPSLNQEAVVNGQGDDPLLGKGQHHPLRDLGVFILELDASV